MIAVIIGIIGIIILIGFIGLIIYAASQFVIPDYYCPKCGTKMKVFKSNVYTGQVIYRCPVCGNEVLSYYDDDELMCDENNDKKSKNNKSKDA